MRDHASSLSRADQRRAAQTYYPHATAPDGWLQWWRAAALLYMAAGRSRDPAARPWADAAHRVMWMIRMNPKGWEDGDVR